MIESVGVIPPLRLGHSIASLHTTLQNGPGRRICLWTQGCKHRCTSQCLNPHLLDPTRGVEYTVDVVHDAVRRSVEKAECAVEGVTVLGGEPFEQALAVAVLVENLRRDRLSIMVYSGHTWEVLSSSGDPAIIRLLNSTDILVDGPFVPEYYDDSLSWRGSTNQRLLCLSDRYSEQVLEDAFMRQKKGFSIHVAAGSMSMSGVQSPTAARAGERSLRAFFPSASDERRPK